MNLEAETTRRATLHPRARSARILTALLAMLATLALASASASAAEEETHVFDATLSLTGNCAESAFDPVPDPGCPDNHAPKAFAKNAGVAVDPYGNRYVASAGGDISGTGGRIDIFDSSGEFITGFPVTPLPEYNVSIAVDSQGYLYVSRDVSDGTQHLLRFAPIGAYNPAAGVIDYGAEPTPFAVPNPRQEANAGWNSRLQPLGVNPEDNHLFISVESAVWELGSAAEGNPFVKTIVDSGLFSSAHAIALDGVRDRLYVSAPDKAPTGGGSKSVVKVFDLDETPNKLLFEIDGSTTPSKRFVSETRLLPIAVDEATGHVFVGDLNASPRRVYEFDAAGDPVSTMVPPGGFGESGDFLLQMAYDNGATSPTKDYLFVPSYSGPGRSLAFAPKPPTAPPTVEALSVNGLTTGEAILRGMVNPKGLATSYRIEYTSAGDATFEEAALAGEGTVKASGEAQPVSAYVSDLDPVTPYRFRIVAENDEGEDEAESTFTTYAEPQVSGDCPNQALRTGPSASLPDCRAYELVTPSNTSGQAPFSGAWFGPVFPAPLASPVGDALSFKIDGGVIPGIKGVTGGLLGDPYLSIRGEDGWQTEGAGASGDFIQAVNPGSSSPDQRYSTWTTNGAGPAELEGEYTVYLRFPDGHSEPLGKGSLATQPLVKTWLITENASHAIFDNSQDALGPRQLEPNAPPDGTIAIYDRSPDGTLHVVSLLPGDVTPGAGQEAYFLGASFDGEGVAFEVGGILYLRHGNEETYEVAPGEALPDYKMACDAGNSLVGASPTYQWLLDGTPIPSATTSTYTPSSSQTGSLLQCRVRAVNTEGGALAFGQPRLIGEAPEGGPPLRPQEVPTLPASPAVGETLQCETGSWSGEPSFTYEWYRNGTAIAGATASSYEVQAADARKLIQCVITATTSGTSVLASSGPSEAVPAAPPIGGTPSISNLTDPGQSPIVGDELSCAKGSWQNEPTLSAQWLANGSPIASATSDTYTLTSEEEGKAVQCEVTATNADGSAKATGKAVAVGPTLESELPSGGVSVKGSFAVGRTLECDKGSWQNSPTFTYQWLRNGTPIGATASTYALAVADRGTVVQCALTATNAKGTVLAIDGGYVNQKALPTASTPALAVDLAGIAEGANRLLYTQGGDIFAYDIQSETTTPFTESALENGSDAGDATPVNVSADGSTAYFLSPTVLTGDANPEGDTAQGGEENLYLSREGQLSFVSTVSERDVEGVGYAPTSNVRGLGLWMAASSRNDALGMVPARTTPDGGVLLFESNATLTDYDPEGHTEIYRYDADAGTLACLSCPTTRAPATGDAGLQTFTHAKVHYLTPWHLIANLSPDGKRVIFESTEALVLGDTDGLRDVYEWEAQGVGSCEQSGGCVDLISSGQSAQEELLYSISESGDDVFFRSSDLLAGGDSDETPSIYDARVNGGFPPPATRAGECLGEACQPAAVAPNDPTPASSSFQGSGNVKGEETSRGRKPCPKGRRVVKRAGKQRCVPKKKQPATKKHGKQANGNRRAGR